MPEGAPGAPPPRDARALRKLLDALGVDSNATADEAAGSASAGARNRAATAERWRRAEREATAEAWRDLEGVAAEATALVTLRRAERALAADAEQRERWERERRERADAGGAEEQGAIPSDPWEEAAAVTVRDADNV